MSKKLVWIALAGLAVWWLFLRKPSPGSSATPAPDSPPPPVAPPPADLDRANELPPGTPVDALSGKPYAPALTATT